MNERWIAAPYGNAVVNGERESDWSWCVIRDDDSEMIEVESMNRAEQIASVLNQIHRDPEIDGDGLRAWNAGRDRIDELERRIADKDASIQQLIEQLEKAGAQLAHEPCAHDKHQTRLFGDECICVKCGALVRCATHAPQNAHPINGRELGPLTPNRTSAVEEKA